MLDWYASIRAIMPLIPSEVAHTAALKAISSGVVQKLLPPLPPSPLLKTTVLGTEFSNPLGIAAGFDKNGVAMAGMLGCGFGFVEVGTVTPLGQVGNPKPRVFRLMKEQSLINRMGFPNSGLHALTERLQAFRKQHGFNPVIGVNIGCNKLSQDQVADYGLCAHAVTPYASYLAINVSSPNTPGLRDMQSANALSGIIETVRTKRDVALKEQDSSRHVPILVKVAPDLTDDQLDAIAKVASDCHLDGLIATNTTITRPESHLQKVREDLKTETGGLSGLAVKDLSTTIIAKLYKATNGKLPIIGVGGISNGRDAFEKITSGASLVQLYTAFVYQGPLVATRILKELSVCLEQAGFTSIRAAVGTSVKL